MTDPLAHAQQGVQRTIDYLSRCCDRIVPYRRLLVRLAFVLVPLLAAALTLDAAHWTRTDTFHGPLIPEQEGSRSYAVAIGADVPFLSIPGPEPSAMSRDGAVFCVLVNGASLPEPPALRQDRLYGIRGLKRTAVFALPIGITNDSKLVVAVEYEVRVHRTLLDILQFCTEVVVLLLAVLVYRSIDPARFRAWSCNARYAFALLPKTFRLLSNALVLIALLYLGITAYRFFLGDPLPPAYVFKIAPDLNLSRIEPFVPWMILSYAFAGTALAWMATIGLLPRGCPRRIEFDLMRFWRFWGLPVTIALVLFSLGSGGWSGHWRFLDQPHLSVAGLLPHSDPASYFIDSLRATYWGQWSVLGSRRPLGQAFRDITTLLAQYSYVGILIVQDLIIGVVLYLSARRVTAWRGIWAGLGFFALGYLIARPFFMTTLTEPLGLAWSLFSLIFFVEAMRQGSLPHAMVALAAMTIGLFTRMGSLFTIPFVVLWIAAVFATTNADRLKVFGASCAIALGAYALSTVLYLLYGTPNAVVGGNFAWTLCGLSVGTDYGQCVRNYGAQLAPFSERAQIPLLLNIAWDNVRHHPEVLLGRLWFNVDQFVEGLPRFFFGSYVPWGILAFGSYGLVFSALVPGMAFTWLKRSSWAERIFWPGLFATTVMSAALVFSDDGWRVLIVTNAMLGLFVAFGWTAPGVLIPPTAFVRAWRWQTGAAGIVIMAGLLLSVPAVLHVRGSWEVAGHPPIPSVSRDEHIVLGGRSLAGFLVVADDVALPASVPAVHASDFVELIRMANLEQDFGPFAVNVSKRVPFVFAMGQRLDQNNSGTYIGPANLLTEPNVWAWRVKLRPQSATHWQYLDEVVAAQPLP